MAALVQSITPPTATVTLLQPSPVSAASAYPVGHSQPRSASISRSMYGSSMGNYGSYRGQSSSSPTSPYASNAASTVATTTATVSTGVNTIPAQTHPHLRPENRALSAPGNSFGRSTVDAASNETTIGGIQKSASMATVSELRAPNLRPAVATDDSSISAGPRLMSQSSRPLSSLNLSSAVSLPPSAGASAAPTRPSPERYRRSSRRLETNSPVLTSASVPAIVGRPAVLQPGSGMAATGHLAEGNSSSGGAAPSIASSHRATSPSPLHRVHSSSALDAPEHQLQLGARSVDDLQLYGPRLTEPAKRYRRRSAGALAPPEFGPRRDSQVSDTPSVEEQTRVAAASALETSRGSPISRPELAHRRSGSGESMVSARSSQTQPSSATSREPPLSPLTPLTSNPVSAVDRGSSDSYREGSIVSLPARAPAESYKRLVNPSPLSRPVVMATESAGSGSTAAAARAPIVVSTTPGTSDSPAAQHLAELNEKDAKKGVKSRLRRAFSFGSAAELRRASAQNSHASAERARLRKERYQDEHDAEQAAIAQKQEAGGIGEGIYSGQGNFFTGSSDNLSVSSTASSASIMIRKMGKGMKKSTRSLVGLFRPRSIVGVPASDAAVSNNGPGASAAQVSTSMVNAEAEPQKVNVNADPHDQAGGGTGFPKLERNSIDAARAAASTIGEVMPSSFSVAEQVDPIKARRSIVGGDSERAEVLAAVKKGILKRRDTGSATSSPVTRPVDSKNEFGLPLIPRVYDSPHSSVTSTPVEGNSPVLGHRRTDSVRIEGEDYFPSLPKPVITDSKNSSDAPQSVTKYSVTFSPRIQFHDTWPSGEYDRRGDIATCNRLTPMLAQQIKEELNTFKMEMEVHEQSKVYTHFF